MVYDFIEPYRIWIDVPIFRLFSGKKVHSVHTYPLPNGVGLTDEGKALIVEQVIAYLDVERIKHHGKLQIREDILRAEAHEFANALLNAV